MITWIQNTFQHHFRSIFAVLLGLIIISFVFVTNASSGLGRAERSTIKREFFGYNLSSQEDQSRLVGDASLSANLHVGYGIDGEQLQNYALQRAATLHLAEQLHLPAATTAEITETIKTLRAFAGPDGQFDAKTYNTFRDNLKTNPRLKETDIARVLGDDVRAEKVQKLLAGPGYVLPSDVKTQLARADTSWTIATASADYASYSPVISATENDVAKFFADNSFRYEFPSKVVTTYADFPAVAFLNQVTLTESEVRAYFDANPTRFPAKPAADAKAPSLAAADFATVRPQVEASLKFERAQGLAVKAASDFAFALYSAKVTAGAALDAALAKNQLTLKPLAPFTRESGPAEFGGSPEIATEAFKLSADRFYSEAVTSPTGAIVLFWKETQPSRKPALVEVRAKVAADYNEGEKRKRFVELGRVIKASLESRLKAGDTIEKAAASAANGVKIEAKSLPAFTLRNRPQDLDYSILGAVERLEKGQVSDMVVTADKGIFVYAIEKKAPDLTEANAQFIETRTQLAAYTARLGSGAIVGEIVAQELKKSEPVVK